ncbi:MAG: LysM peptidoglycan-binding domain-containing protein [Flavobacterium sp.]|uniref:LysM peptidoglycan-binding domain-containing protein n=1 Tax=Flavobacterium sp. TaxID=239 RepID=UPI0025C11ABC|nr:LysM peptidoglycan-binding domain-containing protein [Flavobacterium sp.]MCA1966605.1 LysM peptidoglycan-binding domain-containing protein [Flavobacterium sp.]
MIKRVVFLFSLIFLFGLPAQSQIKHVVAKGETVFQIAKKYEVTPFDIYRLNPDAKNGVQENTTLLIPKATSGKGVIHVVGEKETLFGISKKYNISVADLEAWNKATLQNGLKKGQEIFVSKPSAADLKSVPTPFVSKPKPVSNATTHLVEAKETKYGIATKYGLTVTELEQLNPHIVGGLNVGQTVVLKPGVQVKKTTNVTLVDYEVQPKETLYSLSKKFDIAQADLITLNPDLQDGLKIGMILKVPSNGAGTYVSKAKDSVLVAKNKVNLITSVDKSQQKNMVLLLPFNLTKIETDSVKTKTEQLKTNKFLNLTLDFYAGAQMAIDSAKVLGLPVNVKVYDVESTKYSSNVASIISKNDFENVDVVVGPFQNSVVETTAQLLTKYNTPVISPLSKERGLPLSNLYYTVPSEDFLRASMFDYFKSKNGNVVAIISAKKTTSKDFITANHPDVKHAAFNDKGALDVALLKTQLVKGQKNFVLMEIEKASTILNITNILKGLQKEYDIQLAVFELYDALNFEEIPMKNLTDLKLLFPSATKVAETLEEKIFEKQFKKINNIYPNAAAKKGFDVTFDAMLRICQPEGFVKSAATTKTEYIENAFDYSSNNGMITNNATYLLYYDSDLTIKQAQ